MKLFNRTLSYYKYELPMYILGVILSLIAAATSIYVPMIGKQMIDYISEQVNAQQEIAFGFLIQKFGFFMLIILFSSLCGYASYLLLAYTSNRVSKRLRDEAFNHMQKLPVSYFDDKPAGKISARIVNDVELLRTNFYINFSNAVIIDILTIGSIYVALFIVSPKIGTALLLLFPFFIVWQLIYAKLATPINKKWRESVSDLNSHTAEIVQGVSIVQLYHQQDSMLEEFEETNQTWLDTRLKSIRLDGFLSWDFSTMIKNLVMFAVLLFIGTQFVDGVMGFSIGTIYVIINYISRLFDPILELVRMMSTLQQALSGGRRVFELLDEPIEADSTEILNFTEGHVVFDHVTFGYDPEKAILKEINFSADKGETIGLVGHTGSGKSSIINLLFRFYDPQQGAVLIDGQSLADKNRESIRENMGIVLQEPYLFSGTIATNVSMNDPKITDEMVTEALEKVGGKDLIAKLPLGIHEPVVEKGQAFSSGERQLIAFARTLASDPKILILDEATSHIDTETEEIIQHAMEVVKEGRTTFIVAHRLSTIQNANQILVLDNGEIKEQGTHESLLSMDSYYAEMYRLQAQGAAS
ncbi:MULTISPECIES: ABC transporter ATP-binding protein [Vagococcus]|uniref:Lipid A export ATP-binding/permease protein MsbA n=1 Tax=Vagococcus fluvialis bH819 TaxID=1255619 RepID=A0A1X6WN56_9ENTE|nr:MULTISPECIES: ABC transporter ATP-binding protein [Vagococcus]SLM85116.1 Lipid A export ATP-binding/permease protein MsbA [Vagococcus fluvialis bH819]HCM88467.1 ABC transporter ATP-binding protein [Vagococcus sp.]